MEVRLDESCRAMEEMLLDKTSEAEAMEQEREQERKERAKDREVI